jgi:hypothetical protein
LLVAIVASICACCMCCKKKTAPTVVAQHANMVPQPTIQLAPHQQAVHLLPGQQIASAHPGMPQQAPAYAPQRKQGP